MKPIMLHGHERSITQIKYNREGDLIFSCAKDSQPNVWYSLNGERLGTFVGHNGAVWCIDCSWDTSKVLTGAADNFCKVWDCETGSQLHSIETRTAVRSNGFSYSGNLIMFTTDKTMGCNCEIHVYDLRDGDQLASNTPLLTIPIEGSKITSAIWGPYEESIVTGHENGEICIFDIKSGKTVQSCKDHTKQINDIQPYKDYTMFITASKDNTAKLFDMDTLELKKTYRTERPVNSAAISPLHEHVVLGGGQEAMQVTTTNTRVGKFDARFFHLVFEEEFGRVKGHFGPINSVAFHPDGKSYSSGGEDGYVRVHYFDANYLDINFDY
ncbi:Eukaryotic translation initiation factor 3 subunit I [Biomphalaria glabrata]|uniref:Eukaryotic translation initiation factor 3 subunit I n=2 Tax=Biomphalaria TaxID=6525 RepID=A0A9W2YJI9_BIOGL|nr:eukaryotic translation initiation factor 3 subunit I-like [Biomphalaria glabrata]KAI8738116.1 eukaryotic translation initiation factor 3 subunit I [Biomphalaria glabrata]KAI8739318.1 eukaryotic translation initiation factor 3 subunit I [Biomphalaria glabrata]KAK0043906.1 eukaryotic translation initiation factor 3 subunit I [Biomphalaria pfeifferi]